MLTSMYCENDALQIAYASRFKEGDLTEAAERNAQN